MVHGTAQAAQWHENPGNVNLRHLRGRPQLRIWLALVVILFATSGHHRLTELERIHARGKLVMLTINGATTYYLGPNGDAGFEYDLAQRFADYVGVPLEVLVLDPSRFFFFEI